MGHAWDDEEKRVILWPRRQFVESFFAVSMIFLVRKFWLELAQTLQWGGVGPAVFFCQSALFYGDWTPSGVVKKCPAHHIVFSSRRMARPLDLPTQATILATRGQGPWLTPSGSTEGYTPYNSTVCAPSGRLCSPLFSYQHVHKCFLVFQRSIGIASWWRCCPVVACFLLEGGLHIRTKSCWCLDVVFLSSIFACFLCSAFLGEFNS